MSLNLYIQGVPQEFQGAFYKLNEVENIYYYFQSPSNTHSKLFIISLKWVPVFGGI